MRNYFTKLNLRNYARRNIENWNDCIEDVIYVKYLILACNGKTVKRDEAETYFSRVRSPISPCLGGVFSETKKRNFDLINRNECRKWFTPSGFVNKKYRQGKIYPELFKPLLTKQHFIEVDEDGELMLSNLREISYHNIFNLCLPENLLTGKEGSNAINLMFINWTRDFWVHLFPTFHVDKLDLRTVNNLIALYSEVVRSTTAKDSTKDSNLWNDLDLIINEIETFELKDGYFDLTDNNVYFVMSQLLSGNPKFYYDTVREIKQPLLKQKFNTSKEGLIWAFNNFEPKHFHEIRTLAFNFLEDRIGIDIVLNSRSSLFTKPDTKIDLLIKIFDGVINHSEKNNYYLKLTKLADLLNVIEELPDDKIQEPEQVEEDDQFNILRKRQETLLKTFAMSMLTELFYSDKIKVIDGSELVKAENYAIYDTLIHASINYLKGGFNGGYIKEGKELFDACGLTNEETHRPFYRNRFISHYLIEQFIHEEDFRNELFDVAYNHNLILPRNSKKFPNTCKALKNIK